MESTEKIKAGQLALTCASDYCADVVRYFDAQREMGAPKPMPTDRLKRLAWIREMYAREARCGQDLDPYFIDCTALFTPIEAAVWSAIRWNAIPMLPQYPVGRFFADFADPKMKVVVECDGLAYHIDQLRDARRDDEMRRLGWRVFRIPGHACKDEEMDWLQFMDLREAGFDEDADQMIEDWLCQSADGFFTALSAQVYGRKVDRRIDPQRLANAVGLRESLGTQNKKLMSSLRYGRGVL